jgi:hypothetical protein
MTSGLTGVLMNIVTIDSAILATASNDWQKFGMVIAKVSSSNRADFTEDEDDFELIAQRIEAMIDEGRLVAEGDAKNWRRSEVKLP